MRETALGKQAAAEDAMRRFAAALEARVVVRTAELEEERARLAAVVENMPAGLVIVDPDGKVLMINDRALTILGVEKETSGHRHLLDELPLERTLRTGEAVSGERIQLTAADGTPVVIEVATTPVRDSAGHALGALSLFQDVTLQERQERAERDFVTNAAHELQSPLAAIVSAIEVLQAGAKDSDERDVFLAHIERASARLTRLARALLILARAQMGVEAPRDELVGLDVLLSETASRLRPPEGVEVVVSCRPQVAVVTNRQLLEQALSNLAENAAKNTSLGRIVLAAEEREGSVEITVSDTGRGIAAADRSRVFDRFYSGPVGANSGFGLGLAIVGAAVDALGGEVELESTVGAGSVVRLRLPHAASLMRQ